MYMYYNCDIMLFQIQQRSWKMC